jgi:hypothetical protein
MITAYIIGFFATFMFCAVYNNKCKAGNEMDMRAAFLTSLLWPISLAALVVAVFYDILRKIFDSISKK